MLSPEQYAIERAVCDKAEVYARATMATRGKGCDYLTADECRHPDYAPCNNEMRGRVEQFELNRDKPDRFTCYISSDEKSATVWTGDVIGRVTHKGRAIRPFGGYEKVYQFSVTTIWGDRYTGRGQGGGMCVNLRRCKA